MRGFSIGYITTGLLIMFIDKPTIHYGILFGLSCYLTYDYLKNKKN